MDNPSRADVEHDEYGDDMEAFGHRDEKVTGQDRVRMIPNKRRPALGPPSAAGRPHVPEIPVVRQNPIHRLQSGFGTSSTPRPRMPSPTRTS
jgi:hypothetical protein